MDLGGPYRAGVPVTDRIVAKHQWPKYIFVGAFIPFAEKEAKARYEEEVNDQQAKGIQGPVQLETVTKPGRQTIYFLGGLHNAFAFGMNKTSTTYAINCITNNSCNQAITSIATYVSGCPSSNAGKALSPRGCICAAAVGQIKVHCKGKSKNQLVMGSGKWKNTCGGSPMDALTGRGAPMGLLTAPLHRFSARFIKAQPCSHVKII